MVDGDGMSPAQVEMFVAKNIYPLSVHSVESLYYCDEVLKVIAQRQAETLGTDPTALLQEGSSRALEGLNRDSVSHLASRVESEGFGSKSFWKFQIVSL